MTHRQVEGQQVGKHPMVSRLMRGIYSKRPPTPKYSSTWDVRLVTSYIKGQGRNDQLDLKQLTLKLTRLMALVSANRSSDLAALDLRFRQVTPYGGVFQNPYFAQEKSARFISEGIFLWGI